MKNKAKYLPYIIIFIFSLFMTCIFKLSYINGDDSLFHIANINVIKDNLFNLSKIRPIIANNYGYGIGIFYPQLPHIIGGLLSLITSFIKFDPYIGIKLTKFIILFVSGISMYSYINKLYKSKIKGLIGSITYITSSYFIVDIFYRDALNESFIFMFMPIVFLGLYYLLEEEKIYKFFIFFVLGYVGLMFSHLVLSVWFTLYVVVFLLFNIKKVLNKKVFLSLVCSSIIILLLTSVFTIPMIEHMRVGDYYVFSRVYKATDIWRISCKDYLYMHLVKTSNSYLFVNIAVITLISCFLSFIKLLRGDTKVKRYLIIFLILSGFGVLCTFNLHIWKIIPSMLRNIQFAWRSATFVLFFITIYSVDGLDYIYKIYKNKYLTTIVILVLLSVHLFISVDNIVLTKSIDECTSTCGMGWQKEYLPLETLNNNYIDTRSEGIIILNGDGNIKINKNNVPSMIFTVSKIDKELEIELPRIYYLGYSIKDNKGNKINYKKDKNGFIKIKINNTGKYTVKYTGTILDIIFKYLSIITLIGYIFIIRLLKKKDKD